MTSPKKPAKSAKSAKSTPDTCPQAWHGGLPVDILHECVGTPKHRGTHRNADGSLHWGGKLTPEEHALANELRAMLKSVQEASQ